MKYLIWSNEHEGWWRPNHHGYTVYKEIAGVYEEKEAFDIVEKANKYINWGHYPDEITPTPNESLVPVIENLIQEKP